MSICSNDISLHYFDELGRRQVPNKVSHMHPESPKEPWKHYWVTNRNKSPCYPLCNILNFNNVVGKKKLLYTTWGTPQAVLLPTTFDCRFLPLARWKTNNRFFANFRKPFVTGVKSRNVARFQAHLYSAVANIWWVSTNIPCKACGMRTWINILHKKNAFSHITLIASIDFTLFLYLLLKWFLLLLSLEGLYFQLCLYIYFTASYFLRVSGNVLIKWKRERRTEGESLPAGQRRSTRSESSNFRKLVGEK